MAAARVRLGDLLVEAQMITRQQLGEVLERQRDDRRRLGTLLVESGLVSETQVTQILSQQLAVPWVSLYHIDFSRQLLNLVPNEVVERFCLVPIFVRRVRGLGQTLYVAMDDPTDEGALDQVRQHSGLPVRAMIAPPSDIRAAIRVYYGAGSDSTDPLAVPSVEVRRTPPPKPAQADTPRKAAPSEFDIDVDVDTPDPPPSARAAMEQPPTDPPPPPASGTAEPGFTGSTDGFSGFGPHGSAPAPSSRIPAETQQADSLRPDTPRDSEKPRDPASPPDSASPDSASPDSASPDSAALHDSSSPVQGAAEANPQADTLPRDSTPSALPTELTAAETTGAAPPVAGAAPLAVPGQPRQPSVEAARPRSFTPVPESAPLPARAVVMPQPRSGKTPRMVSLTLLDGTTINLPARSGDPAVRASTPEPAARRAAPELDPSGKPADEQLTARDLVAALRAVSHGADATEILGENARWEAMFAALLSLLLKKQLIADWEFVEEYKRV